MWLVDDSGCAVSVGWIADDTCPSGDWRSASDHLNELIVSDVATSVSVISLEESNQLRFRDLEAELGIDDLELVEGDVSRSVLVVHHEVLEEVSLADVAAGAVAGCGTSNIGLGSWIGQC